VAQKVNVKPWQCPWIVDIPIVVVVGRVYCIVVGIFFGNLSFLTRRT